MPVLDLHCHILPAFDDGAKDTTESLAMLQLARCGGSMGLVATPHVIEGKWRSSWEKIVSASQELEQAAREKGIDVSVYPGAEIGLNWDILENITGPGPYCLNGGSYLLLELPAFEIPRYTEEFFFTLQTKGITPVLAHPERHPELMRRPEILTGWLEKGLLIQLNGPSLMGRFGQKVKNMAELLLAHNMVHCIGSDAHGVKSRKPELFAVKERIKLFAGEATVQRILRDNPAKMLRGEDLPATEIIPLVPIRHSQSLLGRLANFVRHGFGG